MTKLLSRSGRLARTWTRPLIPAALVVLVLVATGTANAAQDPKAQTGQQPNPSTPPAALRITRPTPAALPPFAELPIYIDPQVMFDGRMLDLRDDPAAYTFKLHWTVAGRALEGGGPTDYSSVWYYANENRLVATVPWTGGQAATFVIRCEKKTNDESPILMVESHEISLVTNVRYSVETVPSSAIPGALVEVTFDPTPRQEWLKTATASFDGLPAKRVPLSPPDRLIVRVPDSLTPGSKVKVRARLGDGAETVESSPMENFPILDLPTTSPPLSSRVLDWVLPVSALFILVVGIGMTSLLYYIRRIQHDSAKENDRLRKLLQEAPSPSSASASAVKFDSDEYLPRDRAMGRKPEVPKALWEACEAGKCVVMMGNGVAAQTGLPAFHDTATGLIREGERRQPQRDWDMLRRGNAAGRDTAVADIMSRWFDKQAIFDMMKAVYVRKASPSFEIYEILSRIPCAGVLNWSWDDRFESQARASRSENNQPLPTVLTSSDVSGFEAIARDRPYFLVHLNGTLDASKPEVFVFTYEDYRRKTANNLPFAKFVEDCYTNRTILFVGTGLQSIEHFLTGLKPQTTPDEQPPRHFALVRDMDDLELPSELFRSKYGIELLGFVPTYQYPEVLEFLAELRNKSSRGGDKVEAGASRMPRLDEITLTNIGPFDTFKLELHAKKDQAAKSGGPSWNVLLGNNGCGKSTILRAVALGLCGDDREAREAGGRLLKTGTSSGTIELKFADRTYKTTLNRAPSGGGVLVQSGLTPLQVGRWVALGFAALRGASSKNPTGPGADGRPEPVVRDVLPLLIGNVDWRFDSIKQWIVNTDTKARRDDADPAAKVKAAKILDTFFRVQKAFVPGVPLDFSRVDQSFTIYVKTGDGEVPIDQLSQGTGSVLGWVGTLLQRMYEIYPNSPNPENEHALVLIDEIDAHMHPEWQHAVVGAVRKVFPNVQFLATTHSALIVGDLSTGEVTVLRRGDDEGKIEAITVEAEGRSKNFHGLRFDQLLTSPLFGLPTPRSQVAEDNVTRYQELKRRAAGEGAPLDDAEREEHARLRQFVTEEINAGETRNQRAIEQAMASEMKGLLEGLTPEQAQAIRQRIATAKPGAGAGTDGQDGPPPSMSGSPG